MNFVGTKQSPNIGVLYSTNKTTNLSINNINNKLMTHLLEYLESLGTMR